MGAGRMLITLGLILLVVGLLVTFAGNCRSASDASPAIS